MIDNQQNICRSQGHVIRELPRLPVIAGFLPINSIVSAFVDRVRNFITQECRGKTELNWNYVAGAFYAYRISAFKRKNAFKALARNLSQPAEQVRDMDGSTIYEGVRRTVRANLTIANREGLNGSVEFFNGLEAPVTGDLPPWLAELLITPQLFYVFHDGRSGGCTNRVRSVRDIAGVAAPDPVFVQNSRGEPNTPTFHSSLGFEKNPWRMAYVGVKAESRPRKPFAPFGEPVTIKARAFAKPFGGTIGPWHKSNWSRGAPLSGTGPGEIDRLTVPRIPAPGDVPSLGTGSAIYPYVPNFSKYPGDRLGLKSNLAMIFTPNFSNQPDILSVAEFSHFRDMPSPNGDPLSSSPNGVARTMELAAISPNLFDLTYYSIEPKFNDLYGSRGIWNGLQGDQGTQVQVPFDIGTSLRRNQVLNVTDQIAHTNVGSRRGPHFYFVTDPFHLLTSWHQKGESDYTMDEDRLGKCEVPVPSGGNAPANPGSCIKGGRTGYSVKIVAKDYLLFEGHQIGGQAGGSGQILNPPPDDF